MNVKKIPLKK